MKQQHLSTASLLIPLCVAVVSAFLAIQADAAPTADPIQQRYQAERARCLNGSSAQDRKTCLQEASAARDEARKGRLQPTTPDYLANALARCERVPEADRADCQALARGQGQSEGSVAQGAIVHRLVTREVVATPPPKPASAPQ